MIDPTRPNALVACEESAETRDRLEALGFNAWSCDLLPSRRPGKHYQGDVRDILALPWDLLIAHPPCTFLSSSGLHWNKRRPDRAKETADALDFVRLLLNVEHIKFIGLENPIGCISTEIREPDQIVQPWMFGDDASKATCFWLVGLPPLELDTRAFIAPRVHRAARRHPQRQVGHAMGQPDGQRPEQATPVR